MALTQVSTSGIKDATVATADIADNAVTAGKLASGVQTTINNNADNRVITGSGTANTLNGESDLIFDGTKLGIGMTPGSGTGYLLQLDSGEAQTFMTFGNSGSGNGATNGLVVGNDTSRAYFTQRENQPIFVATNNVDRLVIDENGKVGIGTTSPSYFLHVNSGTANSVAIFESTDAGVQLEFKDSTGTSILECQNDFRFKDSSGEKVRINSSGVTVKGATNAAARLLLQNTTSVRTNYIGLSADDDRIVIAADDADEGSNSTIDFKVDGSERMRIDSSGNVGIGTSSPSKKLHVYDSGVSYLRLETGAANGQAWDFLSTYGGSANTGTLSIRNESGSSFLDLQENGGSPRTTIANGGSVQFQFDADGIKFNGDTAAANGLDDYEEGTWSPGIDKNASSMSCSYSHSTGTYTRIGRLVMVWFDFQVSATSNSGSGAPYITELPFTALYGSGGGSNNGGYGAPTFRDATLVNSDFRVYGTSSYIANKQIYLQHYNSSGSATQTTLNSTGRLTGQAFYFAT